MQISNIVFLVLISLNIVGLILLIISLTVKKDSSQKELESVSLSEDAGEDLNERDISDTTSDGQKERIARIRRIFKKVNNVLMAGKYEFFINCGSLIGWMRNNTIIPHDNDVDICIMDKDLDRFSNTKFKELGLTVIQHESRNIFQFVEGNDDKTLNIGKHKQGMVDVYVCHEYNGIILELWNAWAFKKSHVFPLRSTIFEGEKTLVPYHSAKILDAHYGKTFMNPDPNFARDYFSDIFDKSTTVWNGLTFKNAWRKHSLSSMVDSLKLQYSSKTKDYIDFYDELPNEVHLLGDTKQTIDVNEKQHIIISPGEEKLSDPFIDLEFLNLYAPDQFKFIKHDEQTIPIFIISFQRLTCLKKCLGSILLHTNIRRRFQFIFSDNRSSNAELMDFLLFFKRHYNAVIFGHTTNSPFDNLQMDIQTYFTQNDILCKYYAVTDPDIQLTWNIDTFELYIQILTDYPNTKVVGPMLDIHDIPDSYPNKSDVMRRHGEIWNREQHSYKWNNKNILFTRFLIDTTFGLYRNVPEDNTEGCTRARPHGPGIRLRPPYSAKHLDWYLDEQEMKADEKLYAATASKVAHWGLVRTRMDQAGHHRPIP